MSVFSNAHLPRSEQFEWFQDVMVRERILSTVVSSDTMDDFPASVGRLDMGLAQLGFMQYPALHSRRSPNMIRSEDAGMCWLFMNARGRQVLSHGGGETDLTVGEMLLLSSERPFDGWAEPCPGHTRTMFVALPAETLPLPRAVLDRLVGSKLVAGTAANSGVPFLLTSFLKNLIAESQSLGPQDVVRLGGVLTDLTAAVLATCADEERSLPPEPRRELLLTRIHAFIDRHLPSPTLTPATVAAAHHISVRYLHRVFQEQGTTVGGWIRHRRLERCRRDLADPSNAHLTAQAIGARWGFPRAPELSRAFSAAYGMPPGEYRRRAAERFAVLRGETA